MSTWGLMVLRVHMPEVLCRSGPQVFWGLPPRPPPKGRCPFGNPVERPISVTKDENTRFVSHPPAQRWFAGGFPQAPVYRPGT